MEIRLGNREDESLTTDYRDHKIELLDVNDDGDAKVRVTDENGRSEASGWIESKDLHGERIKRLREFCP